MTTFDEFWTLYPLKRGKKAGEKAWDKLTAEEKAECIPHLTKRVKDDEDWKKDNGKYVPMATTFLNQGRWTDVYETSRSQAFTSEKSRGKEVCTSGCRSVEGSDRHHNICELGMPYYDYQENIKGEIHYRVLP